MAREAARLAVLLDSLGNELLVKGVFTAKGRCSASLSAYTAVFDRFIRATDKLSLERAAKAALDIHGYVAQKTRENQS